MLNCHWLICNQGEELTNRSIGVSSEHHCKIVHCASLIFAALLCKEKASCIHWEVSLTCPWEAGILTISFHCAVYLFFYLPKLCQLFWLIRARGDRSEVRDVCCICVRQLDLLSPSFKPEIIAQVNSAGDTSCFFPSDFLAILLAHWVTRILCFWLRFSTLVLLCVIVLLWNWGLFCCGRGTENVYGCSVIILLIFQSHVNKYIFLG